MELRNYLRILWRRKIYIFQSLVVIPVVTYLFLAAIKPIYKSKSLLLLKPTTLQQKFVANIPNEAGTFDYFAEESFLGTIDEILRSESVVGKVIQAMSLQTKKGDLIPTEKFIGPGKLGLIGQKKGIDIEFVTGSNTFELTSYASDPLEAKRIGEHVVHFFLMVFADMYKREVVNARDIIASRLADVKDQLGHAERRVENYRNENDLYDTDEQIATLLSEISTLETTYNSTLQQQHENGQILKAIQNSSIGSKRQFKDIQIQIEDAAVIDDYKEELLNLELDLANRLTELTEEHIEIRSMKKQKRVLQKMIKKEMARNLSSQLIDNASFYGKIADNYIDNEFTRIELVARIKIIEKQLKKKRFAIKQFPRKVRMLGELMREVDALSTAYTALKADLETTKSAMEADLSNAVVIQPPTLYEKKSYNQYFPPANKLVPIVKAVMFSVLIGVLAAVFVEYLDNRIWSSNTVEKKLGLRVLGNLPRYKKNGIFENNGTGRNLNDSIYNIVAKIQVVKNTPIRGVLSILSHSRNEGKSLLALWMARALSYQQLKVVIVDANLRYPSMHNYLRMSNNVGLSDTLHGKFNIKNISSTENIDCITAGMQGVEHPQALLGSEKFRHTLDELKTRYDIVIIDTAAYENGADALVVAQQSDHSIIVLEQGRTGETKITKLVDYLKGTGVGILGVVMNKCATCGKIGSKIKESISG